MPPQFMDSPSEKRGFLWGTVPYSIKFSCATILLLIVAATVDTAIRYFAPGFALPISGTAVVFLVIATWLFIGAYFQAVDLARGNAIPNKLGFYSPWPMVVGGFIFLVLGILSLKGSL